MRTFKPTILTVTTNTRRIKTHLLFFVLIFNAYFNFVLNVSISRNSSVPILGFDINGGFQKGANQTFNNSDNNNDNVRHDDTCEEWQECLQDEDHNDVWREWLKCDKDLSEPTGLQKYVDVPFLKNVVSNLLPIVGPKIKMEFYLFRKQFPDCGKQLKMDNESLETTYINNQIPTRIFIHGWMSQSRGSFNRDLKDAYLSRGDYNIIICDWSKNAANINYLQVVKLIETLGAQLAEFTKRLHKLAGISYDDIYLIGHSLGAHIAGSAGQNLKPDLYDTIVGLDPSGPKFSGLPASCRLDPLDAKFVEVIQTSRLGFYEPIGSATFYPNKGLVQKNCPNFICSHTRAYKLFAESLNTDFGFWGIRCIRGESGWHCNPDEGRYLMGGDPIPRQYGTFYVATNNEPPYALGILHKYEEWRGN